MDHHQYLSGRCMGSYCNNLGCLYCLGNHTRMSQTIVLLFGQSFSNELGSYDCLGNYSRMSQIIALLSRQLLLNGLGSHITAWAITLECPGQLYYCPGNYSSMSWAITLECPGQLYSCPGNYSAMSWAVVLSYHLFSNDLCSCILGR